MDEQKKTVISSEDSIVLGNLFFVRSTAIKNQTVLAKEAFKDLLKNIHYN